MKNIKNKQMKLFRVMGWCGAGCFVLLSATGCGKSKAPANNSASQAPPNPSGAPPVRPRPAGVPQDRPRFPGEPQR